MGKIETLDGIVLPDGSRRIEGQPVPFQVAIDGTVASGKGRVSRELAEKLGIIYVDTGAMYRCTGLLTLRYGIESDQEALILSELLRHSIELRQPNDREQDGRSTTVLLDGIDVSWDIRAEYVGDRTSIIAQHPLVRAELVRQQKKLAATKDVVMEGRDITHAVLPNAQLKIYLDADRDVRADRRYNELLAKGVVITRKQVLDDLIIRDERDKAKNLRKVPGVWEIDTSTLSAEAVVQLIADEARRKRELR